ncbi:phosphohydrolase [Deinococcus sp. UR1]|uniref:phosphohydrolase n=1 Tax=Deinococcus sp. UR1 TaxID=1704277 RepID=UPI000C1A67A0|nr:phosphohydrolase [Deinococcus sp. UR1]PIG96870.1 phosphohydrolase [Deinococcus sp. UR1]
MTFPSTTPQQMAQLLTKYGSTIKADGWGRNRVMQETGLGESAARRLIALSNGQQTGKRFSCGSVNAGAYRRGPQPAQEAPAEAAPDPEPTPEPASPAEAAQEPTPAAERITTEEKGDRRTVESDRTTVPDPEELMRRAGVDLTVWEIERSVVSQWQMGSMPRRVGNDVDGWRRESSDAIVTPLYSVKVYLKRRTDTLIIEQFKADALAEIRAAAAPLNAQARPPRRRPSGARQLLYVGAHDIHVGKLALSLETMQQYGTEIATRLATDSLDKLLQEAEPHGIARIVLPVGHDLAHFESGRNATSNGTPQDVDGRFRMMRREAYNLTVRLVQRAAEVAPVDVIGVPGNHGYDTDLAIAERLEARFHDHKHVQVQVPLSPRSYYRYGCTLLGLTHGNDIKMGALPLTMADEMPEAWAQTTDREWLLGHFHAKQTYQLAHAETEHRGVRVRILPSISAVDYWHAVHAYSNVRAMEAYRYDLQDGYAGHHSVRVRS